MVFADYHQDSESISKIIFFENQIVQQKKKKLEKGPWNKKSSQQKREDVRLIIGKNIKLVAFFMATSNCQKPNARNKINQFLFQSSSMNKFFSIDILMINGTNLVCSLKKFQTTQNGKINGTSGILGIRCRERSEQFFKMKIVSKSKIYDWNFDRRK